jgi:hypothetical protein
MGVEPRSTPLQRFCSSSQGAVVRHWEIKAEEADDRADQPLRLAQREAKLLPSAAAVSE